MNQSSPKHRARSSKVRFGRTLAPAAAPLSWLELVRGLLAVRRSDQERKRFEAEIRACYGVRHCFAVSSGKAALLLLLRALAQLHPGRDEVLVPAYTCYSVPSAIVRAGLKIRLCDVDPVTLDFDFRKLGALLAGRKTSRRLLCVLPTHFFGLPADLDRLRNLIREISPFPLPILEDAAQAMGVANRQGWLGTLGDAGFFSLGRGKPLSLGEGGIIVTNRDDLAGLLRPMVDALPEYSTAELCSLIVLTSALVWLVRPGWFWLPRSLPWLRLGETLFDPAFPCRRLSGFQAGLARGWPGKLQRLQEERRRKGQVWAALLAPLGIQGFGGGREGLIRYPIRVRGPELREAILAGSERQGLGIMPTYPDALTGIAAMGGRIEGEGEYPQAAALASELLTLPVHHYLAPADQLRIAALLREATAESPGRQTSPGACLNVP